MYIIVGKEVKSGDFLNDSSSINEYFELGWEVGSTHLDIKFLLSEGYVNSDDIIVTHSGREFFYNKLFKKVIKWDDFDKLDKNNIEILDLVENSINNYFHNNLPIHFGETKTHYHNRNLIWNNQKIKDDILFSFNYSDLSKYNIERDFVCIQYRKRNHCPNRNIDENYFIEMINFIKSKGLDIYIVGYGGEKFVNDNVFYVDLRDWASLMNNKNCKLCITTLSGPAYLMVFCSNETSKNIIIDITGERCMVPNNRLNLDVINFKNIKIDYFNFLPLEVLEKYIKK